MADAKIDFASMLCSRLCHDLLSPVGSFGNGLELLADEQEPEMQKRCIELLESSARVAINRLKYFRLAFGSAGGYGDMIAVTEIRDAIIGQIPEGREVTLEWIGASSELPKPAARVLLLLALTVCDALVRGGKITIAVEQRDEKLEVAVRGEGDRVVIDPASVDSFASAEAALVPKTVTIVLAREIAHDCGGDIMLSRPSDREIVVGSILTATV